LPTLVFVGLATFNRVLQSGIEDLGYASRIARLRDALPPRIAAFCRAHCQAGGERAIFPARITAG
jgi:hypothetical protein